MGALASKLKKRKRVLILGLNGAGKSTIFWKIKIGQVESSIPTIGLNIEECTFTKNNITFTVFDVDNKTFNKWSPILTSYYEDVEALIWVVDSNNRGTISDYTNGISSADALHKILQLLSTKYPNKQIPVLIFANKKDLPNAMDCIEMCERLRCDEIKQEWFMYKCYAGNGDGLYEGMDWLSHKLTLDQKNKDKQSEYVEGGRNEDWMDAIKFEEIYWRKKNDPKMILFISGWIRDIHNEYKLNIPVGITRLIHEFYQDPTVEYDKSYTYFG